MTYGELFREVSREAGNSFSEESARHADTVAPKLINVEVPPERLEVTRAYLLAAVKEIQKLSTEEVRKRYQAIVSRN